MEKLIPEPDEAELKVMTVVMYRVGGVENVLKCVQTMQKCQVIILTKLKEILDMEEQDRASNK